MSLRRSCPQVLELAQQLAPTAAQLLGRSKLRLYQDCTFVKNAGGCRVNLHTRNASVAAQDSPAWPHGALPGCYASSQHDGISTRLASCCGVQSCIAYTVELQKAASLPSGRLGGCL